MAKNAKLLIRAGFIHKEMAGVYSYLPLGLKVLNKINSIIREEINAIDGQEISMTALQNAELWKKTDRFGLDVAFKTELKTGGELELGWTHEEPITNIMREYISSYRDLPVAVYQLQTKFRNEERAKSGIMRGREFLMKDLYSFHANEQDLDAYYEQAKISYLNIFRRVGLGENTFITFASGGAFSKYSHEFQAICPAGEDTIHVSRTKEIAVNEEVLTDEVLSELDLRREDLQEEKAVEVGNIFKLGTKYSGPLGLEYRDETGETRPVVMGCYGIGPGRLMGTVAEIFADEKGLVWPKSIAPFDVHLIVLGWEDDLIQKNALAVAKKIEQAGKTVLIDDRSVSAGEKFGDADLIGIPVRAVISAKTGDKIELKKRTETESRLVSEEELLTALD